MKKTLAIAAIAAAFTIVPVTTALATTPPTDPNHAAAVVDTPAEENKVSTWCEQGVKYDNLDGQTFTIPEPPDGFTWTKLILNGGLDGAPEGNVRSYILEPVPAVGTVVTRPGAAVSNAILCYEPAPVQETATTTALTAAPTTAPRLAPTPENELSAAGPVPSAAAWPTGASTGASQAAASQALPTTGGPSWGMGLSALAALMGGLGLVQLSRRTT